MSNFATVDAQTHRVTSRNCGLQSPIASGGIIPRRYSENSKLRVADLPLATCYFHSYWCRLPSRRDILPDVMIIHQALQLSNPTQFLGSAG
jgi:hypothetical protein